MDAAKYRSLYSNRKDQDLAEVFAHFHPLRNPLTGDLDFDAHFTTLAEKTFDGKPAWYFTNPKFETKYRRKPPKLRNYLNYTFLRLRDLEMQEPRRYFVSSADSSWVCFNTGLQDRHAQAYFAARLLTRPDKEWLNP